MYILSVEPAGIGPIARWPYPNSGGIVSLRLSPIHISRSPSSHLFKAQQLASFSQSILNSSSNYSSYPHLPFPLSPRPSHPSSQSFPQSTFSFQRTLKIHSPLNNLPFPHHEAQRRITTIARIKLGPITQQRTAVVHVNLITTLRLAGAFVLDCVFGFDLGGEGEGKEEKEGGEEAHCGFVGLRGWRRF